MTCNSFLRRYALTKHPFLWDFVEQRKIAVQICPISNQILGLVTDTRNHPASSLFASAWSPVVVSNDDPGIWSAQGLTYDFYWAFMGAIQFRISEVWSNRQRIRSSTAIKRGITRWFDGRSSVISSWRNRGAIVARLWRAGNNSDEHIIHARAIERTMISAKWEGTARCRCTAGAMDENETTKQNSTSY